jgi:spermidine synthase
MRLSATQRTARDSRASSHSRDLVDLGVFATLSAMDPVPPAASASRVTVYLTAFVTGAIIMSFEMLGSRYLNPYFGSGIYTWASLISTVLAALCVGYFAGGVLADRHPSPAVLGATVLIASLYLLALPLFSAPLMELVSSGIDDVRTGSLVAAFAILFFPVTFLGMYSPFGIRLLLRSAQHSGRTAGFVYGISTAGSIVGTLGTTFFLIPAIGTRAITFTLGIAGVLAAVLLIADSRRRRAALAVALIALAAPNARAEDLIDLPARAEMLKRADGRIAHVETEYNDIFVSKRKNELTMSFQLRGYDYTESIVNLADPDDLPVKYTQMMTVALAYPPQVRRVLMIGLGGGSIPAYLGRFMPDAAIDTIEIDPEVIAVAKRYFGLIESERVRYLESDGRVYLNRHKERYDLILVDAFQGGAVPFHLLTREFYALLKQHLAPGGAAVFNVHDATKLYAATLATLRAVFPAVHLYPSGEGEVAAVVMGEAAPDPTTLAAHAAALQEKYRFRFSLPALLARRSEQDNARFGGELLTDDFAPVNVYDAIGNQRRKKK